MDVGVALSTEQQEVLAATSKHVCVLAGAGSGKTRTLTYFLAQELLRGAKPEEIVAFTFTEKAAEELLSRTLLLLHRELPDLDAGALSIGTIHGWCFNYLLNDPSYFGFSPLDEIQQAIFVERLAGVLELDRIYRTSIRNAVDQFQVDLEVFYNEQLSYSDCPTEIADAIGNFRKALRDNKLLTFGEMIRLATEQLVRNGGSDFSLILVDEFQDINPAQLALIRAMMHISTRLVVVGDDLQCIYNWRGSDVSQIINFEQNFSGVQTKLLVENYRSSPEIIDAVNAIASQIRNRAPNKVLVPCRPHGECPGVRYISSGSEADQANDIATLVQNLCARGAKSSQIAILVRSVRGSAGPLIDALSQLGLDVWCPGTGQSERFVDEFLLPLFDWLRRSPIEPKNEQEEKDVIAEGDALFAAFASFVPAADADTFWAEVNRWIDLNLAKEQTAYDVRGRLYDLFQTCGFVVRHCDADLQTALGIASQIIRAVEEVHRRRIAGIDRVKPIELIAEVYYSLRRFKERFGEAVPVDTAPDGVVVTTVHQAKGLEWPIVILADVQDRRFPVYARRQASSFPDAIAGRYGTTVDDEARLFYVACTRAKDQLYVFGCDRAPKSRPSLFVRWLQAVPTVAAHTSVAQFTRTIVAPDGTEDHQRPLDVGLSDLLVYAECPYQYGLRRLAGVQPAVGDELGLGKALHELIRRRIMSDHEWSAPELEAQVDAHVFLPLMSEADQQAAREDILKKMQFLQSTALFSTKCEPEYPVKYVSDGAVVTCVIDGLVEDDDGLHIWDWKSGVHRQFLLRYQRQMQCYGVALSAHTKKPITAALLNIAGSEAAGELRFVQIDMSEARLASADRLMADTARGIRDGRFDPKPSEMACSVCDVSRLCSERFVNA